MEQATTDFGPAYTVDELKRRLPEIDDIKDDDLRAVTINALADLPAYFWTAPASSSHHPPEHQARHGLWLHTKRVCTVFERLAESMVKQGHLTWEDIDKGRAACLLHDMFKYGRPPTSTDGTTNDHDVLAARYLRAETDVPDEVADAVEAHNGPWYQGDVPTTHLQQIVHIADMVASDANCRIAVKDPHPVLTAAFPRVSER